MKAKRLIVKNIGIVADADIPFNHSLNLFYGDLRQGKTTLLRAVQFCFGGAFPSDIIRHGQTEASVSLEFDNGSIVREWYVGKDGKVKDRPIIFVKDGKPIKKPVDEIKKLLNPFLLDQDYLRKMGETERKAYFVDFFGVDTTAIDTEIMESEMDAKGLREKLKGYGEIDLSEVKPIDVTPLKENLDNIRAEYTKSIKSIDNTNAQINAYNGSVGKSEVRLETIISEIKDLEERISILRSKEIDLKKWLQENPRQPEKEKPASPDTSIIESQISESAANQVRYEQYQKNLKRADEKKVDEKKLSDLETTHRDLKKQKISKLAKVSETCGINHLEFDESGTFMYEGTQAGMLSTSQIMRLSSELSALYPDGLGIDLIDRAESLGKSIFEYVKKAEDEKKTILAAIVGEKPAKVPQNIGVFVVSEGKVT